ncbi:MAG: hypothetical protein FWG64_04605 [Firmicutes bacterium]|nr:hypothetical protein [Bacillota bacterium]
MNISVSNLFGNNNALGVSRTNSDNRNPLNALTKNVELMQERIAKIREQRISDMQAKITQAQAENSLVPNAENGLTATLTQSIVANDMALRGIAETAATRANIESQIATLGETPELQEALIRADSTLAAQIGGVLSSLQAQNNAISNAQNREESDSATLQNLAETAPETAQNDVQSQQMQNSQPQQTQAVTAYVNAPPTGLVVDVVR